MCGLVGYIGTQPVVTRQRLVHMRDQLRHRGPDDAGIFVHAEDGVAVGLGHRRLSIMDTRTIGRQPMTDETGRLQLVFNGEIYGFETLRAELMARGHRFQTRTDTEVILALYRESGIDAIERLDGMFSFALWDPDQRRLVIVRDRFGIKPLFIAERSDGSILFASEIKALLASKMVDDSIDLQAHHDYLGLNYVPGPRTMLKGIRKLPPAHALVWERGRSRTFRYWQQTFHSELAGPKAPRYRDAAEVVLDGLQKAVQRRMVADVPLGMFLSGGVDSSAILMAMSEASTRPIQAFTIRFAESSFDESEYARTAAKAFGADHHVETVRPEIDTFLGPLTDALDEPYADSSAIPLWYLCQLARRHVTVALGGDGGDEVFAGYRTHFAWRLGQYWRRLPRRLRENVVPALVDRLPVSHAKMSFDLKARAFVAAASRPSIEAHYRFKEFLSEEARAGLSLSPEGLEPTVRLFEGVARNLQKPEALDAVLACDFAVYLPDDILVKVDRMSMYHGLEARVPFLDHRFVETVAALPARYKLRGLRTKAVLKRALRGRVPAQLLKRRKAGFNVPMAQWLLGPLQPLVQELLSPSKVRDVGLWSPTTVRSLVDAHTRRERDHSRPLWALLCFMLFNERYRGGRSA